jgi:hypothetical protein
MTYLCERIKLAHICREIADLLPPSTSKFTEVPYDHVIFLDRKLQTFISSLPFYFRLDAASRQRAKALETIHPNISIHRFCITRAAHSRRIKLHQRFIPRRNEDPLYNYSRLSCLESARAIMEFYDGLKDHANPLVVTTRLDIAVHYMHLALTVLVMDLCFNPGAAEEARVKAEVKAGLKMFESNENIAPFASTFLTSLKDTLRKHNVFLEEAETAHLGSSAQSTTNIGNNAFFTGSGNDSNSYFPNTEPLIADHSIASMSDTYFDDFWQSTVQSGLSTDLQAWDGLLSALDTHPL